MREGVFVPKQLADSFRLHRPAKEESLSHLTFVCSQKAGLRMGLYSFRYYSQIETVTQLDDSANDRSILGIVRFMGCCASAFRPAPTTWL